MPKEPNWKLERLAVADIRLDERFQMRVEGTDPRHVKRLSGELEGLEDKEGLEPVKVGKIGKAHYLLDGFHRIEAHKLQGLSHVQANVSVMNLPDALAYSAFANLKHGKQPSRADKQAVFDKFLENGRHLYGGGEGGPLAFAGDVKSSRVISRELGGIYSHVTIRTKLKALGIETPEAVEYPNGYKAMYGGIEDEEALEAERFEEAKAALWSFEDLYHTLEEQPQRELLQVARGIIEALENGERPVRSGMAVAEPVLDI